MTEVIRRRAGRKRGPRPKKKRKIVVIRLKKKRSKSRRGKSMLEMVFA